MEIASVLRVGGMCLLLLALEHRLVPNNPDPGHAVSFWVHVCTKPSNLDGLVFLVLHLLWLLY